ncbi:hypothetical protein AXF42_Ash002142 [Apostasia shenzhenica]|uniref:Uncharacterized protein n=1 Tax=Apostasia shenzhenica TaxID=1088818 RepID=A0A2I0AMQ0_9ASPA|nr:hypothetical protein AXF42_Ash002142 [Apostasia shenzhenica]
MPSPPLPSEGRQSLPRTSRTHSFSSSASSFSDSPSYFAATPSPSPFHRLLSSSAVPFSWECRPGIPKAPTARTATAADPLLLPLPPPLRKSRFESISDDPFAVAFSVCTKDAAPPVARDDLDAYWFRPSPGGNLAWKLRRFVGFHVSCKTSCSVNDATVALPRLTHRPE